MFDRIKTLKQRNAMGNIKVKYVPSTFKGIIGFNGKKLFVLRWKKQ
jgi:hypothetical protein